MKNSRRPVKSLGQNFLIDSRVQQKIVQACQLQGQDVVVEIGPGQGAITSQMLPLVQKLIAVEKDRELVSVLQSQYPQEHLELVLADFLKWDMGKLADNLVIVGNIPYYISTPIIEKLIANRAKIKKVFLTVQLEFAQRLEAKDGGKDYGSLSCYLQYYFEPKILFKINPGSFHPQPKVQSCFMSLIPRSKPILAAKDEGKLFKFIQTAFMQRRKTIVNALKGAVPQEQLIEQLQRRQIPINVRPEQISLLNFIEIFNSLMI